MTEDPIIGEIRRVRREISARYGHDVRRLGEHFMELEKKARVSGEYRFTDAPQRPEMALHDKPAKTKEK
jgi:hypothetical protein